MRKVENIIDCGDCYAAVVGKGKSAIIYFIEDNVYYDGDVEDFDAAEKTIEIGTSEKYINEWIFSMPLHDFKKLSNKI